MSKDTKEVKKSKATKEAKKSKKTEYAGFDANWKQSWKTVSDLKDASSITSAIVSLAKKQGAVILRKGTHLRIRKNDAPILQIRAYTSDEPTVVMHPRLRGEEFGKTLAGLNAKNFTFNDAEHSEYRYKGEPTKLVERMRKVMPILAKRATL